LAIPRAHHDAAAIAGELVGEILGRPQAADPCIFGPASLRRRSSPRGQSGLTMDVGPGVRIRLPSAASLQTFGSSREIRVTPEHSGDSRDGWSGRESERCGAAIAADPSVRGAPTATSQAEVDGRQDGRSPCPCHHAGRWSPRAPRGCFRSSDGLTLLPIASSSAEYLWVPSSPITIAPGKTAFNPVIITASATSSASVTRSSGDDFSRTCVAVSLGADGHPLLLPGWFPKRD
jgi:hypothetical protein